MKFTKEETYNNVIDLLSCTLSTSAFGILVHSIIPRNRNMRQAAESEIVERLGKSGFGVVEFKQKIKNLRCTYNQECIKIDNIVKTAKGNIKSEGAVESGMFLQEPQSQWDVSYIGHKNDTGIIEGEFVGNEESNAQSQARVAPETLMNEASVLDEAKVTPTIKKIKILHLAEAVKCLQHVSQSLNREQQDLNEHEAFANYVAASLKKLSTSKALLAQHDIQGILMKYRLGDLSSD